MAKRRKNIEKEIKKLKELLDRCTAKLEYLDIILDYELKRAKTKKEAEAIKKRIKRLKEETMGECIGLAKKIAELEEKL